MAEQLAPLEAFQKYAALGPDFLTWILVRVLDTDLPGPPSEPGLKVDIQGPLLFASEGGEARKVTLSGEEAASAPEVQSALRQGKRLMRAKLLFTAVEDTWAFTLDAETFDVKSAKVPVPMIPDMNQYIQMRIESLSRVYHLLDELYEQFLSLRLDPAAWKSEAARWKKIAKASS
ncbi:MAG: hypothetical protein ABI579_01745 [Candidatus Sumerlaeota bacterium]